MHLDLPHLIWSGPPIDDREILARLPADLAAALERRNGCIAYQGGLHVRGACRAPDWHSLRSAWEGPASFHVLYEEIEPTDIPFAEDALGDQYLIRHGAVIRLWAETGEIEDAAADVAGFLAAIIADPARTLSLEPVMAFLSTGKQLEPGQLLMAYPPFCVTAAADGVTLSAMDALERREFLADIARQIRGVPDGAEVRFKVSD